MTSCELRSFLPETSAAFEVVAGSLGAILHIEPAEHYLKGGKKIRILFAILTAFNVREAGNKLTAESRPKVGRIWSCNLRQLSILNVIKCTITYMQPTAFRYAVKHCESGQKTQLPVPQPVEGAACFPDKVEQDQEEFCNQAVQMSLGNSNCYAISLFNSATMTGFVIFEFPLWESYFYMIFFNMFVYLFMTNGAIPMLF